MTQLKICRVQSLKEARNLVTLGVDLLGFHLLDDAALTNLEHPLHHANRVLLEEDNFEGGVLLTKSVNVANIAKAVRIGKFRYVQVHSPAPVPFWLDLRNRIESANVKLIAVIDPTIEGQAHVQSVADVTDYILTDNYDGGTGRLVPPHANVPVNASQRIIAGGLNSITVRQTMDFVKPFAIDIQSGAEQPPKSKNYIRVAQLVELIKGPGPLVRNPPKSTVISFAPHGQDAPSLDRCRSVADRLHLDIGLELDSALCIEDFSDSWRDELLEFHIFHPLQYMRSNPNWATSCPKNTTLIIFQIDGAEINAAGSLPYQEMLSTATAHGLRPAIAINANTDRIELSRDLQKLLSHSDLRDVQLLSPKTLDDAAESIIHTYALISKLRGDLAFGIDRGIRPSTVHRLAGVVPLHRVAVGKGLAESPYPKAHVNALRRVAARGRS